MTNNTINITLKFGSQQKAIKLPRMEALTYGQFAELQMFAGRLFEFIRVHTEADTFYDNQAIYLRMISECLSELTRVDITKFFKLETGDEVEHFVNMGKLAKGETVNTEEVKATLYGVLNFAFGETFKYKPKLYYAEDKDFTFEHNGATYHIPAFLKDALTDQPINPKLLTGQAIEVYDVRKLYNAKIQDLRDGNEAQGREQDLIYQRDLFSIALLVRKEGVPFPDNLNDIDIYVNERAKELQDILMVVGRDIIFFLTNSTNSYEAIQAMSTFLNHLNKKDHKTQT